MAFEPAHDVKDVANGPSLRDGARTWKGRFATLSVGVFALSLGAAKLLVHVHVAHKVCAYFGFCN